MTKKYIINQLGRSMIEMLGVLAIVGILSVGAVSGFSKAMAKYKYTRFLTTYSMFIQDILRYKKDWIIARRAAGMPDDATTKFFYLPRLLEQMGLIPTAWQRLDNETISDDNGGIHMIRLNPQRIFEFQYKFHAKETKKPNSTEEAQRCVSIINDVLKQIEDLYAIGLWRGNTSFAKSIYAEKYCSANKVCLNNLTYNQLYEFCTSCTRANSDCALTFTLK